MTDTAETRWESHNEAGRRLFSQGDFAAAEQEFIAAIREATALGADNVRLASSLSSLGQIKYRQKDLEQAQALFRRALAIRERVLGVDHFSLVQAVNNLATLHYSRGELDQAAKYFARALEICDKNLGEKHPDVAATLNNLARLHFRRNDFAAAAPLLMRLLAIKQAAVGAHHPEVAVILTSLAKVRLAEGQHEDAEQLARRALLIREEIHAAGDPAIATSLETLAEVMAARGLLDDEQRLRKRVAEIRAGIPVQAGGATAPAASTMAPQTPVASAEMAAAIAPPTSWVTPTPAPASAAGGLDRERPQTGASLHPASEARPVESAAGERSTVSQMGGAQAASQAELPRREHSTKSASLPWIEPPTSPALRRPNARPITAPRPVSGSATPAATTGATAAAATPARASSSAPRALASTPAASRQPSALAGPVSEGPPRRRREVMLEETERPRNNSWLKVAIAAVVLLGCGAGAWVYFTGGGVAERVTSSAGATLDPSPIGQSPSSATERASKAGRIDPGTAPGMRQAAGSTPAAQDPSALTASADPAYGASPPSREAPPPAVYAEGGRPAARKAVRAAETAPPLVHDAAAIDTAATPAAPTPDMSRINVDRITSAIGANAKARADSLGRKTVVVKPPDFEKPRP